jgi:GNAT superfamily N-acetyltransferase
MQALSVRAVRDRRDLKAFVALPYRLHAADPVWAPPLRRDVRELLSRERNPFFDHAEAEYFLATRGGRVVGRVAAVSNRLHNEIHGDRVGFFGFFETEDDREVAGALLDRAADWLRERGHDTIRGPASFSTNDECGLLVEGFETTAALMMPHNPPYYVALIERAGFAKAKDLWAYLGGAPEDGARGIERSARAARAIGRRTGVTIRALDLNRFDDEVDTIKTLYNRVWERNWGFVPMTDREIAHMAAAFRPVVIPDLAPIAEKDGQPVGFALALPDFNEALVHNRGGRFLPGALRIFLALKRRRISRARVLLLGVLPELRARGIDAMLWNQIWTQAHARGMMRGEAGWILEDNAAMNNALERMTFKRYKTYRLYDRAL